MKKTLFILIAILVAVYLILSALGSGGEYPAEKLLYHAMKANQKIIANPDVVPPALFASVEKKLQAVFEKYPKTNAAKAAHMVLAEFYLVNKKYDKSLQALDTIIGLYKKEPAILSKAYFLKGNIYERQNQWNKALKEYETVRDKYRETTLGFQIPIYIGNYYSSKGRDAEAAKVYNEAVTFYGEIEKQNRGKGLGYLASGFLADSYMRLKKYEEAGKVVEDTIENYPSKMTYLQYLPRVELIYVKKLQRPDKAIEIYTKVKEKTTDKKLKEFLDKKIEALKGKGNMDSR